MVNVISNAAGWQLFNVRIRDTWTETRCLRCSWILLLQPDNPPKKWYSPGTKNLKLLGQPWGKNNMLPIVWLHTGRIQYRVWPLCSYDVMNVWYGMYSLIPIKWYPLISRCVLISNVIISSIFISIYPSYHIQMIYHYNIYIYIHHIGHIMIICTFRTTLQYLLAQRADLNEPENCTDGLLSLRQPVPAACWFRGKRWKSGEFGAEILDTIW